MNFESQDTRISVERQYYCFLSEEDSGSPRRTEIMKIYWYYSGFDGWGSISDEYILVDDIKKLNKELQELEGGIRDELNMDFYGPYKKIPFISLHLMKKESVYSVNLTMYDGIFDEHISIACEFTEEEWKPYSDELKGWNRTYSLRLGDKAETLVDGGSWPFSLGVIGEITEIHAEEDSSPAYVAVSVDDIGWDNKPFTHSRLYAFDEVRKIAE